jgi:hypothetical protein
MKGSLVCSLFTAPVALHPGSHDHCNLRSPAEPPAAPQDSERGLLANLKCQSESNENAARAVVAGKLEPILDI